MAEGEYPQDTVKKLETSVLRERNGDGASQGRVERGDASEVRWGTGRAGC